LRTDGIKRRISQLKEIRLLKSMTANLVMKPISIAFSYLFTPLLLAYLGNEQYGIWATILSIISWISYFDIGIGNGLRNVLTARLGEKDYKSSQAAVSTAYRIMMIIIGVAVSVLVICFASLNWKDIFKTTIDAKIPILICVAFMGINLLLSLYQAQSFALQKAEWVSYNGVIVQLINLLGILLLSRVSSQNRLLNMALLFSISTFVTHIGFSVFIWKRYPYLQPKRDMYDAAQRNAIVNVGLRFLFLQLSALILFTTDSLIISALFGAEAVTPFNTANKVFLLFSSTFAAITGPLWSRCTLASVQNDYGWIKKMIRNMKLLLIPIGLVMAVVAVFFQPLSDWWLHKSLVYQSGLVVVMAIYVFMSMYSTIYSMVMNGIGKLTLQIVVASVSALVHIPLTIFFAKNLGWGSTGVCLSALLTTVIGNIIFTVYMDRLIKKELSKG